MACWVSRVKIEERKRKRERERAREKERERERKRERERERKREKEREIYRDRERVCEKREIINLLSTVRLTSEFLVGADLKSTLQRYTPASDSWPGYPVLTKDPRPNYSVLKRQITGRFC